MASMSAAILPADAVPVWGQRLARAMGGFLLDAGKKRLPCHSQPWSLRQPLPQKAVGERCTGQHFYSRLIFRGKSTDLVRPKHNKG